MDFPLTIINKKTRNFVPYRINKQGEIVIVSTDPMDTEENCVVTTWSNITQKNLERKKMNEKGIR
jgi:hypothetical protein